MCIHVHFMCMGLKRTSGLTRLGFQCPVVHTCHRIPRLEADVHRRPSFTLYPISYTLYRNRRAQRASSPQYLPLDCWVVRRLHPIPYTIYPVQVTSMLPTGRPPARRRCSWSASRGT